MRSDRPPTQIRRNIDVLITSLEFDQPATVFPSTDSIDAAETLARQHVDQPLAPDHRRLMNACTRYVRSTASSSTPRSILAPSTACC